VKKVVEGFFM